MAYRSTRVNATQAQHAADRRKVRATALRNSLAHRNKTPPSKMTASDSAAAAANRNRGENIKPAGTKTRTQHEPGGTKKWQNQGQQTKPAKRGGIPCRGGSRM